MNEPYRDLDSVTAFEDAKSQLLRTGAGTFPPDEQLRHAQAIGYEIIAGYWNSKVQTDDNKWNLYRPSFADAATIRDETIVAAQAAGARAVHLDPMEAAYRLGSLYGSLLPKTYRSRNGIFYTPPPLVSRLLATSEQHGADWETGRFLDPACGGGAFLAPIAVRMMNARASFDSERRLRAIEDRLVGFELDPFGAWSAQAFAEIALLPLCRRAGRRLRPIVRRCDSLLQFALPEKFDLVVTNPPYGRIGLSPGLREKYARSLFGHANLYTLFTDLSLRLTNPGGIISLVTPTSFLAGEYFKALRRMLVELANPVNFDFVTARKGVFDDVLQETVLATYRKTSGSHAACTVHVVRPSAGNMHVRQIGSVSLKEKSSDPWPLPRCDTQMPLIRSMKHHRYRLRDYGYEIVTGPLVWNRHKDQLRAVDSDGRFPLLWSESVGVGGRFEFRADKRNHEPFFEPASDQEWLITRVPCILLQRTTAKEQSRRLIAAELPSSFLARWGGVVVENHLNIIKPRTGIPAVPLNGMVAILNSNVLDQSFRCLNGSVAVSAFELNALPLPSPDVFIRALQYKENEEGKEDDWTSVFTQIYLTAPNGNGIPSGPNRKRDSAPAT